MTIIQELVLTNACLTVSLTPAALLFSLLVRITLTVKGGFSFTVLAVQAGDQWLSAEYQMKTWFC